MPGPDEQSTGQPAALPGACYQGECCAARLGSTNGTLVNGKPIVKERKLTPGDLVQIGPVVFEFRDVCEEPPTSQPAPGANAAGKDTSTDLPTIDLSDPSPGQNQAYRSDQTHHQRV